MTSGPDTSAIVLAGGRSSRFGSDKLAAEVAGQPLLHHAIRAVAQVCDEVVVVAGRGGPAVPLPSDLAVPARVVADREPFHGPLVALVAGARAAHGQRILVVAGDMPTLVPALLRRLLAWSEGHEGACLEDRGDLLPLPCGLRRGPALRVAAELVADGGRRLRDLIDRVPVEALPEAHWRALDPEALSLRDIDRPSDLPSTGDEPRDPPDRRAARGPA